MFDTFQKTNVLIVLGEANKLYMKLKKDHDTLSKENAVLLGEKKDFARREAELLSEIAQIRAGEKKFSLILPHLHQFSYFFQN